MKEQPRIAEMIKGQLFDGFLLVRAAAQRTSSNGGKYLDMTLCDITGEVNSKMWDGLTPAPAVGEVVRVRGVMQEYNGRAQFRVDKMRSATDADDYDMAALAPCAPESPEVMLDVIDRALEAMQDDQIRALVSRRIEECGGKLAYYPAASKLHHAEKSGLLHHTTSMLKGAEAVCALYPELDRDLICAGVILHDLSKIEELDSDELGSVSEYTADGMLIGHLVRGVSEIDRIGRELGTDPETLMMIEHMILSHHDLPEYGSPKPPMFPEAEVLHALDLLDARMFEMNRILSGVQPGCFSERVWSLDRKLYRRKKSK